MQFLFTACNQFNRTKNANCSMKLNLTVKLMFDPLDVVCPPHVDPDVDGVHNLQLVRLFRYTIRFLIIIPQENSWKFRKTYIFCMTNNFDLIVICLGRWKLNTRLDYLTLMFNVDTISSLMKSGCLDNAVPQQWRNFSVQDGTDL